MLAHGRSSLRCELRGVCWMQTPPPTDLWPSNGQQKGNFPPAAPPLGSPHPTSPTLPLSPEVLSTHHELCCVGKTFSPEALLEVAGLS